MVFLILESLGSTELLFILVMALVFFGPRKLPQLSRSLGKSLADFRRASEDFKHTWDREVSLEESGPASTGVDPLASPEQNSISDHGNSAPALTMPSIQAIAPDQVVARHAIRSETAAGDESVLTAHQSDFEPVIDEGNPSPKRDWI